jgi:hypothetical protein
MNAHDLKTALRNGEWAWPGGYPCYFIAADGEPLSFAAVRENYRLVLDAMRHPGTDRQWEMVGVTVNWEDPDLYCAHSGERIESAYAEEG